MEIAARRLLRREAELHAARRRHVRSVLPDRLRLRREVFRQHGGRAHVQSARARPGAAAFDSRATQSSGTAKQIDQCAPGLVCVEDACGSGGINGRCYQFCRADTIARTRRATETQAAASRSCDVPFVDCTPLPGSNNTGCPGSGLICYIATSDVSRQICDCQFRPGSGRETSARVPGSAIAGLVCVDATSSGRRSARVSAV